MYDIYDEFKKVINILNRERIPYALAGGLAVSILTKPRATEDIDLLILPRDWEECCRVLADLGYEEVAYPMHFQNITIKRLTKIIDDDYIVIAFVLVINEFWETIWEERQQISFEEMPLWIISPKALIKMKELRKSYKDLSDIEELKKNYEIE